MLESVHIRDFKAIRDLTVNLERFTVFVGANGSGKTSILQAIYCADFSYEKENAPQGFMEGPNWVRGGCGGVGSCEITILFNSTKWHVRPFHARFPMTSEPTAEQEFVQYRLGPVNIRDGHQIRIAEEEASNSSLIRPNPSCSFLDLDARQLSFPSRVVGGEPALDASGANLASVLAYLYLNQPDEFERIIDSLRQVVPTIKRVRFRRVDTARQFLGGHESGPAEEILFDTTSASTIPARFASQGTLLTLALLTSLLRTTGPKVVLLDGLELALHPSAQAEAVAQIHSLLDLYPDLQFIATTHSPYLLDVLRPNEIRLTTINDDGDIVCGTLMEHPDFDRWKDEMAPGEMWSVFGEKWLTQRATAEVPTP